MWYNPGDVVSVRAPRLGGFIRHVGIMTRDGSVISNSRRRGGVYDETVQRFASGGEVINHGPLKNTTDTDIVLARAYARIGRPYNAIRYNCEHFVRDCYDLPVRSPQKRLAIAAAGLAALIAII